MPRVFSVCLDYSFTFSTKDIQSQNGRFASGIVGKVKPLLLFCFNPHNSDSVKCDNFWLPLKQSPPNFFSYTELPVSVQFIRTGASIIFRLNFFHENPVNQLCSRIPTGPFAIHPRRQFGLAFNTLYTKSLDALLDLQLVIRWASPLTMFLHVM